MAIVKCPECEGKVSTEAKSCVHCGCDLSFCKECGSVFVGQINVCPECGNSLRKARHSSEEYDANTDSGDPGFPHVRRVYRQWENESGIKIFSAVSGISFLLMLVFSIIGFIMFYNADEWAFDFESKCAVMILMLVLAAICFIVMRIMFMNIPLTVLFTASKLSKWMGRKRIKLDNLIVEIMDCEMKNVLATDISTQNVVRNVFVARAIESDYNVKSVFVNTNVISSVITGISSFFGWLFIILNMKNFSMVIWLSGFDAFFEEFFEFSMIEYWWALIVAGVAVLGNVIYKIYAASVRRNAMDGWFKKKYPEYYNDYGKYISENLKF